MSSRSLENHVVLLASQSNDSSDHGSGFIVKTTDSGQDVHYVVTCEHVFADVGQDTKSVLVNGRMAVEVLPEVAIDADLTLLKVSGTPKGGIEVPKKVQLSPGQKADGFGFLPLHEDRCVGVRFSGKVKRALSLRAKHSETPSINAWEIDLDTDQKVSSGLSGSPVLHDGKLVGVVAFSADEGKRATLISAETIYRRWPKLFEGAKSVYVAESPPDPGLTTPGDDPQKGRFGRAARRNGLELSARLIGEKYTERHFFFEIVVKSQQPPVPLVPPAKFYLHSSYRPSVLWVRKVNSAGEVCLRDCSAYGVFTVGCQIRDSDGKWVNLEYDLRKIPGLPARFKTR